MQVEKSLKRFWPYLIAFRNCISNGKPEKLLYTVCVCFFISNFMKSRAVYEASLCTFVLRSEIMISSSMKFDISLQNFKKPLVDISSPKIERNKRSEEYLVMILAVERKL